MHIPLTNKDIISCSLKKNLLSPISAIHIAECMGSFTGAWAADQWSSLTLKKHDPPFPQAS